MSEFLRAVDGSGRDIFLLVRDVVLITTDGAHGTTTGSVVTANGRGQRIVGLLTAPVTSIVTGLEDAGLGLVGVNGPGFTAWFSAARVRWMAGLEANGERLTQIELDGTSAPLRVQGDLGAVTVGIATTLDRVGLPSDFVSMRSGSAPIAVPLGLIVAVEEQSVDGGRRQLAGIVDEGGSVVRLTMAGSLEQMLATFAAADIPVAVVPRSGSGYQAIVAEAVSAIAGTANGTMITVTGPHGRSAPIYSDATPREVAARIEAALSGAAATIPEPPEREVA